MSEPARPDPAPPAVIAPRSQPSRPARPAQPVAQPADPAQPDPRAGRPLSPQPPRPGVEVNIGAINVSLDPELPRSQTAPAPRTAPRIAAGGIWTGSRDLARGYVRGV